MQKQHILKRVIYYVRKIANGTKYNPTVANSVAVFQTAKGSEGPLLHVTMAALVSSVCEFRTCLYAHVYLLNGNIFLNHKYLVCPVLPNYCMFYSFLKTRA